MRALDRKLLRDLGRMKAQAAAVALVMAAGVALFLAAVMTYRALRLSEEHYYTHQRFAHVWAHLARAPDDIVDDVARLPGVAAVDGRVTATGVLDVPGTDEPGTALLTSIPPAPGHAVNDVYIRRGRHVEAGRPGEALVSEAFADANHLAPGDRLSATIAGGRVELRVVGIALSPEHVMQVPPGAGYPDDQRFAVIWMARDQVEALLDMRGAINDLAIRVTPGADPAAVIREVDRILTPYGGLGAYGRSSQASHVMLEDHIDQLKSLAIMVPSIFLAVAIFLVNVVLSRLIATQRAQIGMLKAFGYPGWRIAAHYLEMAILIVAGGIALGVPVGLWLGKLMAVFYASFFRFPVLVFRVETGVIAAACAVALGCAFLGALGALRRVIALPPSVAMSPEAPTFRRSVLDRVGIPRLLSTSGRMILRNVTRRPVRAVLTTAGMALAVAVLVLGGSSADGINRMVEVQYDVGRRDDMTVMLAHTQPLGAWRDFAALPGVERAEPFRAVAARVRGPGGAQDVSLVGLVPRSVMRRPVDADYHTPSVPPRGALVGAWLARRFELRLGEPLAIEIRDGRGRTVTTQVAGFVDEPLGVTIYMDLDALGRLLDEPETINGVFLHVDPTHERDLYRVLERTPAAASLGTRRGAVQAFHSMSDASLRFIRRIEILFSVIIAFGVVYNGARIAQAERAYELATLRVLGFTRGEISAILLGEIGLLAILAVPLGFLIGHRMAIQVAAAMSSERFRMPNIVEPATYAFAVLVFLIAAVGSALLVRRRLDRLDLVEVLKARE